MGPLLAYQILYNIARKKLRTYVLRSDKVNVVKQLLFRHRHSTLVLFIPLILKIQIVQNLLISFICCISKHIKKRYKQDMNKDT
jgi:hypothetical protein